MLKRLRQRFLQQMLAGDDSGEAIIPEGVEDHDHEGHTH